MVCSQKSILTGEISAMLVSVSRGMNSGLSVQNKGISWFLYLQLAVLRQEAFRAILAGPRMPERCVFVLNQPTFSCFKTWGLWLFLPGDTSVWLWAYVASRKGCGNEQSSQSSGICRTDIELVKQMDVMYVLPPPLHWCSTHEVLFNIEQIREGMLWYMCLGAFMIPLVVSRRHTDGCKTNMVRISQRCECTSQNPRLEPSFFPIERSIDVYNARKLRLEQLLSFPVSPQWSCHVEATLASNFLLRKLVDPLMLLDAIQTNELGSLRKTTHISNLHRRLRRRTQLSAFWWSWRTFSSGSTNSLPCCWSSNASITSTFSSNASSCCWHFNNSSSHKSSHCYWTNNLSLSTVYQGNCRNIRDAHWWISCTCGCCQGTCG